MVIFIAEAVFLYYDLSLAKTVPSWLFIYMTISLLVYQALDAFDGMHARNLRACSPLGQLFDAGIDAPLHGIIIAAHLQSVKAGSGPLTFLYFHSLVVSFGLSRNHHVLGQLLHGALADVL